MRANNIIDKDNLQSDLDNLVKWSTDWQLRFNATKCHHLHIGKETGFSYTMEEQDGGRISVSKVTEEKDLGIIIDKDLKFQHHIAESVKKANRKLGLIRRSFSCLDKEIFSHLYKSIVRPNLEYGCNIWSVIYKKDAILLENVQRRATKLVPEITGADPGIFVRGGPTFRKFRQAKKKKKGGGGGQKTEEKTEGCDGSSPSADVIDFPDNYLYTSFFSVGHGLLYNCKPLFTQVQR